MPELTTSLEIIKKKADPVLSYMFHEAVPPLPCAAKVLPPRRYEKDIPSGERPFAKVKKRRKNLLPTLRRKNFLHRPPPNPRPSRHKRQRLPLHLVGLVAIPEVEGSGEVATEVVLLLDAGEDVLVDGLLVASTSAGNLLLL